MGFCNSGNIPYVYVLVLLVWFCTLVSMHPFLCLFTVFECVWWWWGRGVLPSTAGWSHIFMTGFIDYNWATFLIELLEWVSTILEFWR